MTSPRLVFVDVETTSLRLDRRAWEVGLIVREPDGSEIEHEWFIEAYDLDLGNADPQSLQIGRYWTRHPAPYSNLLTSGKVSVHAEERVMSEIARLTLGTSMVGANVSFDLDVLAARMRETGHCPAWEYHPVDVEAAAAGRLGIRPPWKLSMFLKAFNINFTAEERHTALGDARLAMRLYDAIYAHHAERHSAVAAVTGQVAAR